MNEEMECFRKAAELGCPDFEVMDSGADEKICFPLGDRSYFSAFLPYISNDDRERRVNRYAAAVCCAFWHQYRAKCLSRAIELSEKATDKQAEEINIGMMEAENFEIAARAFGKKYGALILILALSIFPLHAAENAFAFATPIDLTPAQPIGASLPIAADGHTTAHGYAVAFRHDGKDTLLISARHVLESNELKLRPARICIDSKWYDLSIDKEDRRFDLIVLRLRNQLLKTYPIRPMSELMDGATYQLAQMTLPGALAGTKGSPSGRGILTRDGRLEAIVVRQQSINGVPVMGECTVSPANVLNAFLGGAK